MQGLQCKFQEISFKISTKKADSRIFSKDLEISNFGHFMIK